MRTGRAKRLRRSTTWSGWSGNGRWTFPAPDPGTEQRNTSSKDDAQFCGGGATGVRDATDYPAFMRYALRASLKAAYSQDNLGFRCAGDA